MHEPRIVCPGQGKFWRKSERICNKPFGLHCIYHTYKEGCCNRHPKRLFEALQNVLFETTVGKDNYSSIIAMSDYMVNEALIGGFKQKQIDFNPYFTPVVPIEELIDSTIDQTKKILYVGRLSRTKGIHYLIEAAKYLISKQQDVLIEIAGSGQDEEYIKSRVPDELKNFFKFYGWLNREEINELMLKSYIVVFPSIYPEAFGIVGIEAMMRGKPVVGFDVGGVCTWLKDGITGFVAKVKNSSDLSDKILKLIEDKKLYQDFSRKSRQIALKDFSPNVHIERLIQLYNNTK
jgi:glycosyltransferase involved in cell wall biosynthesis